MMNPTDTNYYKEYAKAFQELYNFSLQNQSDSISSDELSRITHGELCRYTKDLLDALVVFRQSFLHGQRYILKEIGSLQALIESDDAKNTYDPRQFEVLKKLASNLKESYDSVCNLVERYDFNHF